MFANPLTWEEKVDCFNPPLYNGFLFCLCQTTIFERTYTMPPNFDSFSTHYEFYSFILLTLEEQSRMMIYKENLFFFEIFIQ